MPRAPKSCANPLFFSWVQEFHDAKDYRKRGGPPRATGYENALRAIEACPTCVKRLTEKLEEHCARRGIAMPEFKKKERARKAPAAPKKTPASRIKKREVDEEADEDADFSTRGADDDDENIIPPAVKRAMPRRAAARKTPVVVDISDSE
ncbi:hypothetical protein FB45DRAFT_1063101 [Roridomyces roridus]|uniref:Crossover junction endonuclease MUS81-like HHH domain-containing protein n=1 Tax=Roridomyces roridus TaxID=1738132 RepID=A0AAD7BDZ6_9AGAR|nr:hypothetical protein FB45DRAFT_1063101 [Roridomyces roridus]